MKVETFFFLLDDHIWEMSELKQPPKQPYIAAVHRIVLCGFVVIFL